MKVSLVFLIQIQTGLLNSSEKIRHKLYLRHPLNTTPDSAGGVVNL